MRVFVCLRERAACFTVFGTGVWHVAHALLFFPVEPASEGSDSMHMCRIIHSEWMCACVRMVTFDCYYFHVCLWWVVAHEAYGCLYVHASGVEAFVSELLPFIFLSGWLNSHMPVMCVCAHAWGWVCALFMCVLAQAPCVCGCEVKCLLAGLMESWRRAEVKEEICRKDMHHFPHYYSFFFLLCPCLSPLLLLLFDSVSFSQHLK